LPLLFLPDLFEKGLGIRSPLIHTGKTLDRRLMAVTA
jgi:hypothetical protein